MKLELNTPYKYGELTRGILNEEPKKGGSKIKQMKQIESLYKVEQKGRKYILTEKYGESKEVEDGRGRAKKNYSQYIIEDKYDNSIGVYKIILNNQIYIGSTIKGFRERFISHISKFNTLPTKEMLDKGATFDILQICNGMSENEIRHIEDNWIEEYRNNPEWEVVNELKNVAIKGEGRTNEQRKIKKIKKKKEKQIKPKKQKYKKIKIKEEDFDKVIKLLQDNNIDIEE